MQSFPRLKDDFDSLADDDASREDDMSLRAEGKLAKKNVSVTNRPPEPVPQNRNDTLNSISNTSGTGRSRPTEDASSFSGGPRAGPQSSHSTAAASSAPPAPKKPSEPSLAPSVAAQHEATESSGVSGKKVQQRHSAFSAPLPATSSSTGASASPLLRSNIFTPGVRITPSVPPSVGTGGLGSFGSSTFSSAPATSSAMPPVSSGFAASGVPSPSWSSVLAHGPIRSSPQQHQAAAASLASTVSVTSVKPSGAGTATMIVQPPSAAPTTRVPTSGVSRSSSAQERKSLARGKSASLRPNKTPMNPAPAASEANPDSIDVLMDEIVHSDEESARYRALYRMFEQVTGFPQRTCTSVAR
jgi:hypothetical protein